MDLDTVTRHFGLQGLDWLFWTCWIWMVFERILVLVFLLDFGFCVFLQDVGFSIWLFQNSKNKKLTDTDFKSFGFFRIGFKKIQYLDGWFILDDIGFMIELNQSTSETKIVVKPLAV